MGNGADAGHASPGVKKLTDIEYDEIQRVEAATWTRQPYTGIDPATGKEKTWSPYPSFEGKRARERKYQQQLLNLFRISGFNGIAVDVGCGPQPVLEQIDGNFIGIGVDPLIMSYAVDHPIFGEGGWKKTLACPFQAETIPLPTASVHYVISTNALDHCQDPRAVVREIARILRPSGTFFLSFCVNNASVGHPHPAHKIDLTIEDVRAWADGLFHIEAQERITYGWRNQDASLMVLRRYAAIPKDHQIW